MALRYIPDEVYQEMLSWRAEWSMGYHLAQNDKGDVCSIVVGGQILIDLDDSLSESAQRLSGMEWLGSSEAFRDDWIVPHDQQVLGFEKWCETLDYANYQDVRPVDSEVIARFILDPIDPVTTPRGPSPKIGSSGRPTVHGHLPFQGKTAEGTVFYRAEPFPKSRSVDPKSAHVSVGNGLYCFPASELPFVPTGFAAVGRYALPNVAPSIFRWELKAPAGVPFSAGASVPLFGQAGGGVELCIEADFTNVGHIANPVVLPSL